MRNLVIVLMILVAACKPSIEYQSYGEEINDKNAVQVAEFVSSVDEYRGEKVKLEGTIVKTCKMKGCWMTVDIGDGKEIRVTFKDYGFFVPKEGAEDKRVVFEGVATQEVIDVGSLQHFAQDAGKSDEEIESITEPKREITFVASGVLIQ